MGTEGSVTKPFQISVWYFLAIAQYCGTVEVHMESEILTLGSGQRLESQSFNITRGQISTRTRRLFSTATPVLPHNLQLASPKSKMAGKVTIIEIPNSSSRWVRQILHFHAYLLYVIFRLLFSF